MKRFLEWIQLKTKLHGSLAKPPFVKEGDIFWASLGENIGREINGKGESFARAVIIIKKLSYGFYLIIPTSSKIHKGKWFVLYNEKDKRIVACLHQIRVIDYRRLRERIGQLSVRDLARIRANLKKLYSL